MRISMITATLAAATALLGACDNGPSAVETRDRAGEVQAVSAPAPDAPDRAAPARESDAGFTSNSRSSSAERAQELFERNGGDFAARSPEDLAAKAKAFIDNPPAGVETVRRANGDTLYYHAASNTFAVANSEGVPRTMFKPDDGLAYWQEQKDRASRSAS